MLRIYLSTMIDLRVKIFLNTDQVAEKVKASATQQLAKCALLVEGEAKKLLSRGGKAPPTRDGMGKFVKGAFIPAPVGQPPHLRSGNLRASIKTEKTAEGSYLIGPSALYGRIHEFGGHITVTAKMRIWLGMNLGIWKRVGSNVYIPKRPFMRPALNNCLTKFPALFENIPIGGIGA